MATPAEHGSYAEDLVRLADSCKEKPFGALPRGKSWEIVLRFYAALHIVEGYLLAKGEQWSSSDHGARRRKIKAATELKQGGACFNFFDLQDLSENVRYVPTFTPDDKDFEKAREWSMRVVAVVGSKLKTKLEAGPDEAPKG